MAIKTLLTVSGKSTLTVETMKPFEQKIQKALANSVGHGAKEDIYCNINVDINIPPEVENRLVKIGKNLFVGVLADSTIEDSLRRAFIFECLNIKDEKANSAKKLSCCYPLLGSLNQQIIMNPKSLKIVNLRPRMKQ